MKYSPIYIEGDLFAGIIPNYEAGIITLIPHVVNDVHVFGAGFVIPLARQFPIAKSIFLAEGNPVLGTTQFVEASNLPVIICNMFGQHGVGFDRDNKPPIRYDAIKKCMYQVKDKALELQKEGKVQIATCLFGSGLAGGDETIIATMVTEIWAEIETRVYYLPKFLPKGWTPPQYRADIVEWIKNPDWPMEMPRHD